MAFGIVYLSAYPPINVFGSAVIRLVFILKMLESKCSSAPGPILASKSTAI